MSAESRFFERTRFDDPSVCWIWAGWLDAAGYGRFWVNSAKRKVLAHRFSYELFVGPIPDGLVIDHLCRNPRCVNPSHMEPVKSGVNVLRGVGWAGTKSRQTHCIRGHEFDEENTYLYATSRRCKTCRREYSFQYRAKKKQAA